MTAHDKKLIVWGSVLVVLLFLGVAAFRLFREASMAAEFSAHAALAAEIEHRLGAVPQGQRYPDSLSQLHLTYPDGGTTSLLSRFTYRSTGTSCTVRTVVHGQEFLRNFP